MSIGSGLARLDGYPFEVRYSEGYAERARASADVAADGYGYLGRLFSGVTPDIAVVVADRGDWESRQPYGLPFFDDDDGQIRPGVVVMSAGPGDFWVAMGEEIREVSPDGYARLLAAYPDGAGGLDLQPFFDLVTIHELGHAFEVLGGLRLPTFWLSEIFANLALHAFVATKTPESLDTLEVLSLVGAHSPGLDARVRAEGYSTLEDLETHYTGGDDPMGPLNYVWYQYRWQRIAADVFNSDGEDALTRLWDRFAPGDRPDVGPTSRLALAQVLTSDVSATLGQAIRGWG